MYSEFTTIEFFPEKELAVITVKGEPREVSISEAFSFAFEKGENENFLKVLAEKLGILSQYHEAKLQFIGSI